MTPAELVYDLRLKAKCAVQDVEPAWCTQAADCIEKTMFERFPSHSVDPLLRDLAEYEEERTGKLLVALHTIADSGPFALWPAQLKEIARKALTEFEEG